MNTHVDTRMRTLITRTCAHTHAKARTQYCKYAHARIHTHQRTNHAHASTPQAALAEVRDPQLRHTLQFGIGLHHAGLSEGDRGLVERLYNAQKIQARGRARVLRCPRDAVPSAVSKRPCW